MPPMPRKLAHTLAPLLVAVVLAAPAAAATHRHPAAAATRRHPAAKRHPLAFPGLTVTRHTAAGALTPYMGIDTWYAFGSNIDEQTVVRFAGEVVSRGLKTAGYRYVWLDGGWWNGSRDANGNIVVDTAQWPHGMAWLVSYIHSLGLLAGIYTDAGAAGCGGGQAGSYGHYQQDVNTFAAWGFDAVKVDFCGGDAMALDPRAAYGEFAQAIQNDQPQRPMLLNICNAAEPGHYGGGSPAYADSAFDSWSFAPAIAASWRTSYDIGSPGYVPFSRVLHNLQADAAHPEAAGPGHFNDPDYLVPDEGLTGAELRAQVTMWAMLAAPMMVSTDLASLSIPAQQTVENPEVIAIDQDPLVVQGTRVATRGATEIWVKPLAGGQRAVAFLNTGPATALASASGAMLGWPRARHLAVRDVWQQVTSLQGPTLRVRVPADGAVLLRVQAA